MKNFKSEIRKIGIELEYHGPDLDKSAEILSSVTGGEIRKEHEDLVRVTSEFGDFRIETDARFIKKLSRDSANNQKSEDFDLEGRIGKILKAISGPFVPTEIVTPPLPIDKIGITKELVTRLRKEGAKGSMDAARFAFGAQLNPELRSMEPADILKTLKSFMMLSDWLKNQIQVDLTRKLTAFASDFPGNYQKKIFDPDYSPDMKELMSDYLEFNPTRNRSLDLTPLFGHINEEKVRSAIGGQKLKPRPTWHYRLPNSQISRESWNIDLEWSRWLIVEKLSDDESVFNEMSESWLRRLKESTTLPGNDWLVDANNYVERIRS